MKKMKNIRLQLVLSVVSMFVPAMVLAQQWGGNAVDEGSYYLYNVASQQFLCSGYAQEGLQVSVDDAGYEVTLVKSGDGYTILTGMDSSVTGVGVNSSGYPIINRTADVWVFEEKSPATYTLYNGSKYLSYSGDGHLVVATEEASDNSLWKLVTREERIALMDEASADNPVNVSFLISDPDFNRKNDTRFKAWQGIKNTDRTGRTNNYIIRWAGVQVINVYQTIGGLRKGSYKVTTQSFYRDGSYTDAIGRRSAGTEQIHAFLFANEEEAPVISVFTPGNQLEGVGRDTEFGWMPDSKEDISDYFMAGKYNEGNEVTGYVSDGTLTFGLRKNYSNGNDYVGLDHFRLYYLGDDGEEQPEEPNEFEGNTVAAGTYYLYNMSTKRFLSSGWQESGLQAALDDVGYDVELKAGAAEGDYQIFTKMDNETVGLALNSSNVPIMNRTPTDWTFTETKKGSKIYTIGQNGLFLQYASDGKMVNVTSDATLAQAKWMLVSKEERLAKMAEATKEEPVNVSFLISDPDFNRRNDIRFKAWKGTVVNTDRKGSENNYVVRYVSTPQFDVHQTIEGLEDGIYRVSVQSFYRDGSNLDAAAKRDAGTEEINSYFFANDSVKYVMSVFEDAGKAGSVGMNTIFGYVPDSATDISTYFTAGLYDNNIITLIVDGGVLTFGVKKDYKEVANDYAGIDHFRLYYLGKATDDDYIEVYSSKLKALNDSIQTLREELAGNLPRSIFATLKEVVPEGNTPQDYKDAVEKAQNIVDNANQCVAAYADYNTIYAAVLANFATDYVEIVEGAHEALRTILVGAIMKIAMSANVDDIVEVNDMLLEGGFDYLSKANPAKGKHFDATYMLVNPDLRKLNAGDVAEGWKSELQTADFIVGENELITSDDGEYALFVSYENSKDPKSGFVVYQPITLPQGLYSVEAVAFAARNDFNLAFTPDVHLTAGEAEGTAVTLDYLSPYTAEFSIDETGEVKVGLKAGAGNEANWIGLSDIHIYKLPGDEDAVNTVSLPETQSGPVYNLNGQRIQQPARGIYIQNGKKIVVR